MPPSNQPNPTPSNPKAGVTDAMATFRVPFFGIYWANSIFEFLAFGIQQTAKQWLITDLTASRTVLGLVGFIIGVIGLVISPFAGVLSDRMSKRNLLVITRVFFLLILFVEGVLVLTGTIRVWHVLIASVALGIFQAVQNPPSQTYVFDIVGKDRMQHAVALSAGGAGVSQMVGPLVGGVLIGVSGVAGAYGVAGVALGIGSIVLLMIPIKGNPVGGGSGKSAMHDLKEGFVYIARDKPLMLVMIACSMALFNGAFGAMRPIFARHVLEVNAVAFGIMSTANGVGAIVGAVMVALVLPPIRRPGIGITIAMLAYATTMFLYSFAFNFTYILVIEFASGFVGQMWQVNTISGLQRVVPEHMRGRIISVIWMVVSTASIGNLFVGMLADAVGDQLALGIFGLIPMVILTLELIFFWKPLMSMKASA